MAANNSNLTGESSPANVDSPASPGRQKSPTMPPLSPPSPRRPPASRAHTFVSANSLSVPSTPFYTPQVSSVNVAGTPQGSLVNVVTTARRLLVPTVRPPKQMPASPRMPSSKPSPSKLGRSRAPSLSAYVDVPERVVVGASDWIAGGEKFEVVEEQLELEGFQIYAVEMWYALIAPYTTYCLVVTCSLRVVARKRPVFMLTVYTGDAKHKVLLFLYITTGLHRSVLDHGHSLESAIIAACNRSASCMGQCRPEPP